MFSTLAALGGLVWKRRFRLTPTQKLRHRLRLRAVDNVVETVAKSGVQLRALDLALSDTPEREMTPQQKYWVESKRYRHGIKPAHWVPKWTRVPFMRRWTPTTLHEDSGKK